MRRTYRSKKDTGGGLDHRDAILNMDDKSSAFDAFYIQNIKQTKRELSCVGSSNQYGVASNKVCKRKYVKRIKDVVKVIEHRKSLSLSAYLTPDRSIRVNKAQDPFDMLLNSTPTRHVQYENKNKSLFDDKPLVMKREAKTYTKNKFVKATRHNYSSHESSESDKENSNKRANITNDTTDIRTHELLVERAFSSSPKNVDESINNIVKNISLLNHLKKSSSNDSFKTPFRLNKHRLTRSIQSPILQQSPLSSTPFKEKYRSVSIFKFSPILVKNYEDSPNHEKITEDKHCSSDLFVNINKEQTKQLDVQAGNYSAEIKETKKKKSVDAEIDLKNSILHEAEVLNEVENLKSVDLFDNTTPLPSVDTSTFQHTEMEPFLGFSSNLKDVVLNNEKENEADNIIDDQFGNIGEVEVNKNHTIEKSFNLSHTNEVNNKDDVISLSSEEFDKESSYDTCNSEELSVDNKVMKKEPIVRVERMNNSSFVHYYEKMAHKHSLDNNSSSEEDFATFQESSDVSTESDKSSNIEQNSSSNKTEDSSTMSSNDDGGNSNNAEETCISFVTTRRRNEVTNKLTMSLYNNSSGSGNSNDFDKTVLSNSNNNPCKKYDLHLNASEPNQNIASDSKEIMCMNNDKTRFVSIITLSETGKNQDSLTCSETPEIGSTEETLYAIPFNKLDSDDNSSPDSDTSITYSNRKSSVSRRKSTNKERVKMFRKRNSSSNLESSLNTYSDKYSSSDVRNEDTINDCTCNQIDEEEKTSGNNDTIISVIKRKTSRVSRKSRLQRNSNRCSNTGNHVEISSDSLNDEKENDVTLYALPPCTLDCSTIDSANDKRMSSITTRRKTSLSRKSSKPYNIINNDVRFDLTSEDNQTDSSEITSSDNSNTDSEEINMNNESDYVFHNLSHIGYNPKLQRESNTQNLERSMKTDELMPVIVLQPGKKWERSLSIYRRMTMINQLDHSLLDESIQMKGRKYRQSVISTMEMQDFKGSLHNESINSRRSTFVSKPSRSTIRIVKDLNNTRVSLSTTTTFDDLKGFLNDDCDDTIVGLSKLSIADAEPEVTVLELHDTSNRIATARDYVLRRCNQTDVILFDELYPDAVLKNCHKIGEGVYGEVFLWRARDGRARVMKIVPVAGLIKVNGETQKDFQEIISEIVIAMELSALRAPIAEIERHFDEGKDVEALDLHTVQYATDVFNEVVAVRCVYGSYPSRLLDLWDLYDECKGSDNDNPAILPADQQYIVLELANAGQDLESYQFNNAEQAHALFLQVAFGLAVGEEAYQFEHRDLHWGNVLIAPTDQKLATFVVGGRAHRVPRCGVAATIIDYSLSRLSLPLAAGAHAASLYNDLATDDGLFGAVGDYQFEVYRLMRDKLGNDWKNFEPYTNILWLHYTVDKMITALRYKRTNTKIHKHFIDKLKSIKNRILDYKSAADFVLTDNEY